MLHGTCLVRSRGVVDLLDYVFDNGTATVAVCVCLEYVWMMDCDGELTVTVRSMKYVFFFSTVDRRYYVTTNQIPRNQLIAVKRSGKKLLRSPRRFETDEVCPRSQHKAGNVQSLLHAVPFIVSSDVKIRYMLSSIFIYPNISRES